MPVQTGCISLRWSLLLNATLLGVSIALVCYILLPGVDPAKPANTPSVPLHSAVVGYSARGGRQHPRRLSPATYDCASQLANDIRRITGAWEGGTVDAINATVALFVDSNQCSCSSPSPPAKAIRVAVFDSWLLPMLSSAAQAFVQAQGADAAVQVISLPYVHSAGEIKLQLTSVAEDYAGFIVDNRPTNPAVVLPFPFLSLSDAPLQQHQQQSKSPPPAAAAGPARVSTLHTPLAHLLMWYRLDVFQDLEVALPTSWDDLVTVTTAINKSIAASRGANGGTSAWPPGSSRPLQYALCLDLGVLCKGGHILAAMLASLLQYQGTSQGFYFDPSTMTPLVDNAAMEQALDWIKQLAGLNHAQHAACSPVNTDFIQGRCAVTIDWDWTFLLSNQSDAGGLRGTLGVAQLPGSSRVLKERTGKGGALAPCVSQAECPAAVYEEPMQQAAGSRRRLLEDSAPVLVNRAPFVATAGFTCALPTAPSAAVTVSQQLVFNAFTNFVIDYVAEPLLLATLKDVSLASSAGPHVRSWVAMGYDAGDTVRYLQAMQSAVNGTNVAPDIAVPLASYFRSALDEAVQNVTTGGQTAAVIMAALGLQYAAVQEAYSQQLEGSTGPFAAVYASSIGYTSSAGSSGDVTDTPWFAATIAVSGALFLALVVLALLAVKRSRRLYQSLFSKVSPPGIGPNTTLLVTDIQNSTFLWETLFVDTMDRSVKLHHHCIRTCAIKRGGYESLTEGDSFILAFHTAHDAMRFSMECQLELMYLPWPAELLAHTEACPIWIVHHDAVSRDQSQHAAAACAVPSARQLTMGQQAGLQTGQQSGLMTPDEGRNVSCSVWLAGKGNDGGSSLAGNLSTSLSKQGSDQTKPPASGSPFANSRGCDEPPRAPPPGVVVTAVRSASLDRAAARPSGAVPLPGMLKSVKSMQSNARARAGQAGFLRGAWDSSVLGTLDLSARFSLDNIGRSSGRNAMDSVEAVMDFYKTSSPPIISPARASSMPFQAPWLTSSTHGSSASASEGANALARTVSHASSIALGHRLPSKLSTAPPTPAPAAAATQGNGFADPRRRAVASTNHEQPSGLHSVTTQPKAAALSVNTSADHEHSMMPVQGVDPWSCSDAPGVAMVLGPVTQVGRQDMNGALGPLERSRSSPVAQGAASECGRGRPSVPGDRSSAAGQQGASTRPGPVAESGQQQQQQQQQQLQQQPPQPPPNRQCATGVASTNGSELADSGANTAWSGETYAPSDAALSTPSLSTSYEHIGGGSAHNGAGSFSGFPAVDAPAAAMGTCTSATSLFASLGSSASHPLQLAPAKAAAAAAVAGSADSGTRRHIASSKRRNAPRIAGLNPITEHIGGVLTTLGGAGGGRGAEASRAVLAASAANGDTVAASSFHRPDCHLVTIPHAGDSAPGSSASAGRSSDQVAAAIAGATATATHSAVVLTARELAVSGRNRRMEWLPELWRDGSSDVGSGSGGSGGGGGGGGNSPGVGFMRSMGTAPEGSALSAADLNSTTSNANGIPAGGVDRRRPFGGGEQYSTGSNMLYGSSVTGCRHQKRVSGPSWDTRWSNSSSRQRNSLVVDRDKSGLGGGGGRAGETAPAAAGDEQQQPQRWSAQYKLPSYVVHYAPPIIHSSNTMHDGMHTSCGHQPPPQDVLRTSISLRTSHPRQQQPSSATVAAAHLTVSDGRASSVSDRWSHFARQRTSRLSRLLRQGTSAVTWPLYHRLISNGGASLYDESGLYDAEGGQHIAGGACLRQYTMVDAEDERCSGTLSGPQVLAGHVPSAGAREASKFRVRSLAPDIPSDIVAMFCGETILEAPLDAAPVPPEITTSQDHPAQGHDEPDTARPEYRCLSWTECVKALWRLSEPPGSSSHGFHRNAQPLLIFRGLRVRMGMHTGVALAEDISTNFAAGRVQYGGHPLQRAREVSDAACGGMVLCSGETFRSLPLHKFVDKAFIVFAGDHVLPDSPPKPASCTLSLYQGVPASIHPRLVYLDGIRSKTQLSKDTPSAPVGYVTICFMYVAGAQVLLQDLGIPAQVAMELFHAECYRQLMEVDGYLVEAADGFLLTAFHHPADALLWSLRCQRAMVDLPWPHELLAHELAEEMSVYIPQVCAVPSDLAPPLSASVPPHHLTSETSLSPPTSQAHYATAMSLSRHASQAGCPSPSTTSSQSLLPHPQPQPTEHHTSAQQATPALSSLQQTPAHAISVAYAAGPPIGQSPSLALHLVTASPPCGESSLSHAPIPVILRVQEPASQPQPQLQQQQQQQQLQQQQQVALLQAQASQQQGDEAFALSGSLPPSSYGPLHHTLWPPAAAHSHHTLWPQVSAKSHSASSTPSGGRAALSALLPRESHNALLPQASAHSQTAAASSSSRHTSWPHLPAFRHLSHLLPMVDRAAFVPSSSSTSVSTSHPSPPASPQLSRSHPSHLTRSLPSHSPPHSPSLPSRIQPPIPAVFDSHTHLQGQTPLMRFGPTHGSVHASATAATSSLPPQLLPCMRPDSGFDAAEIPLAMSSYTRKHNTLGEPSALLGITPPVPPGVKLEVYAAVRPCDAPGVSTMATPVPPPGVSRSRSMPSQAQLALLLAHAASGRTAAAGSPTAVAPTCAAATASAVDVARTSRMWRPRQPSSRNVLASARNSSQALMNALLAMYEITPCDDAGSGGGVGGVGDGSVTAAAPKMRCRVDEVKKVVCRGLRLKAGCDVGLVSPEVSATTGRMVYRGRVMNRAARICSQATAGHVLTSRTVWACAQTSQVVEAFGIEATSHGLVALKGMRDPVELFDCRLGDEATTS